MREPALSKKSGIIRYSAPFDEERSIYCSPFSGSARLTSIELRIALEKGLLMLSPLFLTLLSALCLNQALFCGGKPQKNDEENASYVEPGQDQGNYFAIIRDNGNDTAVNKLSFAGDTTIKFVKKENDNSNSQISLGEIESIVMVSPLHISKRYPQQELSSVLIKTINGITEEMLMPRNLTICGQARESGLRTAWQLRKIESIRLQHPQQMTAEDLAYEASGDLEPTLEEEDYTEMPTAAAA